MKEPRSYATASAFRIALETRLKTIAGSEGMDLQRVRRMVAFDRLLARLFFRSHPPWVLKGGYALELRNRKARTTKDIDLVIEHPGNLPNAELPVNLRVREELQEHVTEDTGDHFVFLIGEPVMDINVAPYGGARYPVRAQIDGRDFVRFHIDVGVGDIVMEPVESVDGIDWLDFAGIQPPEISVLSKEQQFAEKLHAYTLPYKDRPNSRVKDLLDMVMLIKSGDMDLTYLRESIDVTFERRKTHALHIPVSPPPEHWRSIFKHLADESGLHGEIDAAFTVLSAFVEDIYP